jgi:hypothetical protein
MRHMTQVNGSAVMSLHDPGFKHRNMPSAYPRSTNGVGVVKELAQEEALDEWLEEAPGLADEDFDESKVFEAEEPVETVQLEGESEWEVDSDMTELEDEDPAAIESLDTEDDLAWQETDDELDVEAEPEFEDMDAETLEADGYEFDEPGDLLEVEAVDDLGDELDDARV